MKVNIIDLESTCWEGQPPPGQQSEIIEIGLTELDTVTGERKRAPRILIRPTRSSISAFCTQLTGITSEDVNDKQDFSTVWAQLQEDYQVNSRPWASWGRYDYRMLESQCSDLGLALPCPAHSNAKAIYSSAKGLKRQAGMSQALHLEGIRLEGKHHQGDDDAWNISSLVQRMIADGLIFPS